MVKGAEQHGLLVAALPLEHVLPVEEITSGYFASTRALFLWRTGDSAPALLGDGAALHSLFATGSVDDHEQGWAPPAEDLF